MNDRSGLTVVLVGAQKQREIRNAVRKRTSGDRALHKKWEFKRNQIKSINEIQALQHNVKKKNY